MSKGTLAQHRGWANKSQEDVAKATGVSVNSISKYERGMADPKFTFILDFASWLSIDVSDIIISQKKADDSATD